jgi:predicted Zn-dependent protease
VPQSGDGLTGLPPRADPARSGTMKRAGRRVLKLLLIIGLVLFLGATLLPRLGSLLGGSARKPFRQAKWMWSWVAGSEAESIEAEREYGRECARQFARQFKGSARRSSQQLVTAVGAQLAKAVNDPRREFAFTVVNSPVANAYAIPGGFVFITEPLVGVCGESQDELAFILGHEIGHILCGHARNQLTASALLNAVTSRLPGAGAMLGQFLSKGYARELELEADREGARLTGTAGFDRRAAVTALRRLGEASTTDAGLAEYFSSHPPFADRIRSLGQSAT